MKPRKPYKPKERPCPLSISGTCQFGGTKSFNYGFMWGSHDFCRHPHQMRPIYPVLANESITCPIAPSSPLVADRGGEIHGN